MVIANKTRAMIASHNRAWMAKPTIAKTAHKMRSAMTMPGMTLPSTCGTVWNMDVQRMHIAARLDIGDIAWLKWRASAEAEGNMSVIIRKVIKEARAAQGDSL